ncbi:MAG TPA: MG2 domain-containing protein, partial [Gemmatimonadales bacterium]|nr:MG2 domain-containing protein [Gemmatimonadales bacterium]
GLTSISSYDPDLSPWRFNVRSGYGNERLPVAAAVFTERGIYRPGEPLYAKAIVRRGNLGALQAPLKSDSIRWTFNDRDGGLIKEITVAPSAFGTSDQKLTLPADLPLGSYSVSIKQKRGREWIELASTSYRIAEYRPPEFLVDVSADSGARFPGDSANANIEARYLFGAPMGRAAMTWVARQTTLDFWELGIPETEGFYFGENGWWWEDYNGASGMTQVIGQGADTLDASGRASVRVGLVAPPKGRPARATIEASITDVNRQAVANATSFLVHPSSFYIGAKPVGKNYFWSAGEPASVQVIAARPNGERVSSVKVAGTIVRREWHRVHRTRDGYSEVYGEWVSDTVARCNVTTSRSPVDCRFTPPSGGTYIVTFETKDEKARPASTSVYRWATGAGYVPWNDDSQFKMDVIPDKTRYAVGDTATVLFASPFADADAWITIEREGLIDQQRLRLTSGATTLKFPVTEQWAPNAFVSIVVTRGRSAKPGPLDDPGRPTIRVGYAELRVTPEVKRLAITVAPRLAEYRPGDTARVDLTVKDRAGKGQKSEVTLWAVDEGVLALTGYRTPDPIDLLYAPRGLGLRLASNMTVIAAQVPEGEKGRNPGGGGGLGESDILRSQFRTTAFFLGSVVTDSLGRATASAKLPDNLTTFRVMAVAVTAGDRYGNGQSPMLVSRPLLARPALPRFLREGDRMSAGVVVNQRAGGTPQVKVDAEVAGARLEGPASKTAQLEAGRGREVRFDFSQPGEGPLGLADSSTFRFGVTGAGDADAVQKRLAVRPAFRPRAWTVSGVLNDTATADLVLPEGLDPARSRLQVTIGASPLSVIKGLSYELRVYPYYCTEQASSAAQPIIALYRAQQSMPKGVTLLPGNPKRDIELAVSLLSRRQRQDGGIGYWKSDDWTTPWLSALAGNTLLDARAAGIAVDDSVLARLAEFLRNTLKSDVAIQAPVIGWYSEAKATLSDKVAAADFLSRYGKAEVAAENDLLRSAPQLAWEDRARLAEILARRKAFKAARGLLQPTWDSVKVEGRGAVVPETAYTWRHYFYSRVRPISRLLTATLAVDSNHALIGPLVETLVAQGRAGALDPWNTQDYASAVAGLTAFDRRVRSTPPRSFTVKSGGKVLMTRSGTPAPAVPTTPGKPVPKPSPAIGDSAVPLTGLVSSLGKNKEGVRLALAAEGEGNAIYYYITVHEVPKKRPVNPEEQGIRIERWYEKYDEAKPITSVAAGELVRVRMRLTVPSDRTFVVVDDALPAGLEAVDLSLRTASLAPGPGAGQQTNYLSPEEAEGDGEEGTQSESRWYYGSWDSGWWSPFDHKEIRDDRVVYSATVLWKGTYTMTYIARATTPGTFVRPPAHAEEMYNPAVYGRSDGGTFVVSEK